MAAKAFKALTRAALQKLAQANQIKANLKSLAIIDLLVEKNVPVPKQSKARAAASKSSRPSAQPSLKSRRGTRRKADGPAEGVEYIHSSPPSAHEEARSKSGSRSSSSDSMFDYSTPPLPTDYYPVPPFHFQIPNMRLAMKDVLKVIGVVDGDIIKLDGESIDVQAQTAACRDRVRAEYGTQERINAYLTYWVDDGGLGKWNDDDIRPDGPVRLDRNGVELATSEESDSGVVDERRLNPSLILKTLRPGEPIPEDYPMRQKHIYSRLWDLERHGPMSDLTRSSVLSAEGLKEQYRDLVSKKRRLEEDDDTHAADADVEDNRRSKRIKRKAPVPPKRHATQKSTGKRRRDDSTSELAPKSKQRKPSPPIRPKSLKGKEKMTPEEVQEMQREELHSRIDQGDEEALDELNALSSEALEMAKDEDALARALLEEERKAKEALAQKERDEQNARNLALQRRIMGFA